MNKINAALKYLLTFLQENAELSECCSGHYNIYIFHLTTNGGQVETEQQIKVTQYRSCFVNWDLQRALLRLNAELQEEGPGKVRLTYCVALMDEWSMIDSLSE